MSPIKSLYRRAIDDQPSAGAGLTTPTTPHISKKERRLIMNRNSARLRRKRHAEKMNEMEGTVRELEISNKRMRTENNELRRAVDGLKVLLQKKKQAKPASSATTITPDGAISTLPVESATQDTTYESLAAAALAKYAGINLAPEKQGEEISPKTTLVKPTMSPKYATADVISLLPPHSDNALFRSYLLYRAAAQRLFTRNPSAEDRSPFIFSADVRSSSIRLSIPIGAGMSSTTTAEIEATKLAAQQLTALAFMG